ncbi:divergent polysaccharide deacetylase family protein [Leisingera sp.]|uniref:divergent polysaccharide deacetylase family protein n=1 Tax=Leisingera sp. TaxID=1879318 RepID=UPI003A9277E7
MRGFLGGVSVGALLAAGGMMMLSLSVPLPERLTSGAPKADQPVGATGDLDPAPAEAGSRSQPAPEMVETTDNADASSDVASDAPLSPAPETGATPQLPNGAPSGQDAPTQELVRDADLAEAQPTGPGSLVAPDDLSALADADTTPTQRPEVSADAAIAETAGPDVAQAPAVGGAETITEPQPQLQQPEVPPAPQTEAAVVAATDPAPLPVESDADDRQEDEEDVLATLPPGDDPVVAPEDAARSDAVRIVTPPSGEAVSQAPDIGTPPRATTLPVIGIAPTLPENEASDTDLPEAEAPSGEAETDQVEDTAGLSPQIGTPVVPLTERDDEERISAVASGVLPFAAYSEPFENPDGRPLMSIVLIDDEGAVGAEALAEFPYPLSFAIDPEDPDAAAKMAARRAAGFEVLMLADLPRDAAPQDAETALEVWRRQLPEAVAILEGVETGVQGNRPLADQVAAVAASAGYGLVTQNSGLNTVQKLALRDGVPAGVVFRDFDGAGQDPRAIRRFLDQAAFRAGQEGAVIMLGRLRPDTISALLIWGLQDRASRVALAPVSASLLAKLPPK